MNTPKGTTLIEFSIYIGIVAMVLGALVSMAFIFISDQTKLSRNVNVSQAGEFALDKITYHTKRSSAINASTVYVTDPGILVLDDDVETSITFDTYDRTVTIGGEDTTITSLRMRRGASAAIDLTGESVHVRSFVLTDAGSINTETIDIHLELEAVNSSASQEFYAAKTWDTTITLRAR